jgi:hypothetical protein
MHNLHLWVLLPTGRLLPEGVIAVISPARPGFYWHSSGGRVADQDQAAEANGFSDFTVTLLSGDMARPTQAHRLRRQGASFYLDP